MFLTVCLQPYSMTNFRVRIDFGTDGVVDIETTGTVGGALRTAYEEALNRKQEPVSVNVLRVIEERWEV